MDSRELLASCRVLKKVMKKVLGVTLSLMVLMILADFLRLIILKRVMIIKYFMLTGKNIIIRVQNMLISL